MRHTYRNFSGKAGFLAALLLLLSAHAVAESPDWLSERQALAGRADLVVAAETPPPALAHDVAAAMGAPLEWLRAAEFLGAEAQTAALPALGVIGPLAGDQLAVLSTGRAGTEAARPGTGFRRIGSDGAARLVLHFDPPAGGRRLSFHYRFLTAEYPEFAEAGFADRFRTFVTDANGRREVATVDSTDSSLVPVSAESAGGTGFDLFSTDRGRVTGAFDFGLPAAGLTGWRRVEADLAQSGPVSVEFEIRDGGDDLLDSAVLLDKLSLQAVRMERAVVDQPRALNDALNCLFQGGIVVGAVADGQTPINVSFFNLPGSGTVTFSFPSGSAPEDGGWDELFGDQRLPEITVPTQLGPNGHEGVSQYLVPEEFNRGGNENQGMRNVVFRLHFIPDDPELDPQTANLNFQLWRPPVILMHGLWSSAEDAWGNSPLRSDSRLRTFPGDYEGTHASWFSRNTLQPTIPLRDACNAMWNGQVALSQVDYVGHSMGGIIGRNFNAAQPGLINKFFTVNTPHTGSPLGNVVVAFRNRLDSWPQWVQDWVYEKLEDIEKEIDKGALDDLSKGSAGIAAIPATQIPSHALVGIGGSDLVGDALAMAPGKIGVLFKILNYLDDTTDLFAGIQHDFVVGRRSQEGGIAPSAITIFDSFHSIHTEAPSSSLYRDRIVELLNSDQTSAAFAGFPAPLGLPSLPLPAERGDPDPVFSMGEIEITLPTDGAVFAPGADIPVSVAAVGSFDLASALVFSSEDGVIMDAPPFEGTIAVPESFLGPMRIAAMGTAADGTVTLADSVDVLIQTSLDLNSIEVIQRNPVLFDYKDRRQLAVMGTFSDGIVRPVSHPSTGTVYSSADTSIARITEEGLLVPISEGETTIVVQNGTRQDSITVRVNEILYLFIDRFQPDQQ